MPPVHKPKRHRTKHYFKEWREYRGLSRERAADRLGWSVAKIGRVENGTTPFNEDDLYNAAEAYRCTPSDLLEVNPLKEGEVIDLLDLFRNADEPSKHLAADVLRRIIEK